MSRTNLSLFLSKTELGRKKIVRDRNTINVYSNAYITCLAINSFTISSVRSFPFDLTTKATGTSPAATSFCLLKYLVPLVINYYLYINNDIVKI